MKSCDVCGSHTLADDGDEYGEWRHTNDPTATDGKLIICVSCDGDMWDGDAWYRKAQARPEAEVRP